MQYTGMNAAFREYCLKRVKGKVITGNMPFSGKFNEEFDSLL